MKDNWTTNTIDTRSVDTLVDYHSLHATNMLK
jgi:hypothetical protein